MAEIASAYVSLLPSARGMGRQIESEVGGEVDQAGVSLGKRLGSGIARAAATAAATLGAVAVAAGTVGIRTAAQLEQAEIGFTTMLGSGEKAQAFLSDLAGFAAKTPFELPELQKAASSLVSVGVSADKVIPIMTSLGNATSGMGTGSEGIQRATVALQQMNAAGRITGEDLNQLRDAGIPVYDLLAAATGKSVEAVAELAQKGKLGRKELEQLMGALESGAGLERFTGLMEVQSQSLVGMWSTLKDTFSMGMADAVQPLIPLIKDGLGGATAFVAAQMPALKAGLLTVATGAMGLFDLFAKGDYTSNLQEAFGWDESHSTVDALFRIREGAIGLFDLLTKGDYTGNLYSAFGWDESSAAVDGILRVRDAASGLFDLLINGDFSGKLTSAFGWEEDSQAVDTLFNIRDAVIAAKDAVATFMSQPGNWDAVGAQMSTLGVAAGSVGQSVTTLVPVVREFLAQMPSLTDVVTVGATALGFLADHADLLMKAMPLLVGAVVAYKVAQLASNIAVAASPAIRLLEVAATRAQTAAMREFVATQTAATVSQRAAVASTVAGTTATNVSTASTIRQRIATAAAAVAHKAAAIGMGIATAAQWLWNAALTANPIGIVIVAIAALVAALVWFFTQTEVGQKIVTAAWAGIQAAASAVGEWFTTTLPQWWQSVLTSASNKWGEVVAFFRAIPGKILAFFLNWTLPGLLIKHWDSIQSSAETKFGEVITFVKGVPQKIADGLGSLGAKLASAGRDLMQGLIDGITEKVGSAVRAVKDAVGSVISGAKNLLGIASPSKVFMELGRFTGEGFRLGLEAESGAIQRATSSLVAIPDAANRNLGAIGVGADSGNPLAAGGVTVSGNTFQGLTADEVAQALHRQSRRLAAVTGMRRVAAGV